MFSFKISKKPSLASAPVVAQKSLAQTSSSKKAFNDDDDKDDEEPDFIDGLDGSNIISKKQKKSEKKAALIIPLISKNEWRIDKSKNTEDCGDEAGKEEGSQNEEQCEADSLQEQAVKELLQEASSKGSADKKKKSKSIPILFQNRVPDGYEEDDNMDVSLRPEQSTLDDYERIPVEEFGLAVLRGMGWKETEGIGLKNKKVVDMAEPKLRPKGMGLGAEAAHLNKNVVPQNSSSANEEKEDLSFKIGGYAMITKGSKKGYYGQIESFDEDNNRVILKLGISGKMEAVSKFYINIVPSKEYKKNAKVINSEKYEVFKAKQDKKDRQRRERNTEDYDEERQEPRRRKTNRSDSDSDDNDNHRSRSKSKRKERDDNEYDKRSDRSGHKDRDSDRNHQKLIDDDRRDRRDDHGRDRHASNRHESRKHDDRDHNRNDDYHRNSSRNGDRKGDRDLYRSKKDDDRERRRRD